LGCEEKVIRKSEFVAKTFTVDRNKVLDCRNSHTLEIQYHRKVKNEKNFIFLKRASNHIEVGF